MIKQSILTIVVAVVCLSVRSQTLNYYAVGVENPPVIDGVANDSCWARVPWANIAYPWDGGGPVDSADFFGRVKWVWTPQRLYMLAVITDDVLRDDRDNPTDNYWEDDCLQLYIDENHEVSSHLCGSSAYQAFAYHIAAYPRKISGEKALFSDTTAIRNIVDLGTSCNTEHAILFNDHAQVRVWKSGNKYTWEIGLLVFDDGYSEGGENTPVELTNGKAMGIAVAYADNDEGQLDRLIGTEDNHDEYSSDNPAGSSTAIFGRIELVEDLPVGLPEKERSSAGASFVFPVPAKQFIYLDPDFLTGDTRIRLLDGNGVVVIETNQTGLTGNTLSVNGLSAGVYYVQLIRKSDIVVNLIILE